MKNAIKFGFPIEFYLALSMFISKM